MSLANPLNQLQNLKPIEDRLWETADGLRANSNLASNEYFLPVMGLIFLRHAFNRFKVVRDEIVATLPTRGGKTRPLTKEDFAKKGALYLQDKATFDYLAGLPDGADRAQAIIEAMDSIEGDYETLAGILPKQDYHQIDNDLLSGLLRTFNDPELQKAGGDVFGRIYEYFLTKFAGQKAHDGGEFFTPVSLVQTIVNIIEPTKGDVLDPACGSGGMFVQSAHFIETMKENPSTRVHFYGMEKNPTTIRLAKMNLAVHGLEGKIGKAISYYEDPHELLGKADYVMANPPFNVDEIDAERIKNDPRLPFGLPGVNNRGKVSNGNYVWISYFHSYLKDKGKAGFVMSSQASSARGDEAKVRQKLIETGDVEAMFSIRGNFFYTRPVPCELWFFNRGKPKAQKDKVLMIDARHVYRKVNRTIMDFSPEQQLNLTSIVWLYRGESERFLGLVASHINKSLQNGEQALPQAKKWVKSAQDYAKANGIKIGAVSFSDLETSLKKAMEASKKGLGSVTAVNKALPLITEMEQACHALIKAIDELAKVINEESSPKGRDAVREASDLEDARKDTVEALKLVRYFTHHAQWLLTRFPDAKLVDVAGLVKVVDWKELKENDWGLSPARYVGVAPQEEEDEEDFEESMRSIHQELESLHAESVKLHKKIARNFEELLG